MLLLDLYKTRKAILNDEKLYELEDWEVLRDGYIPAASFHIKCTMLASIPSLLLSFTSGWIISYADYADADYYKAKETIFKLAIPLIIFIFSYISAVFTLKKQDRECQKIKKNRNAFLFFVGVYNFWSLFVFQTIIALLQMSLLFMANKDFLINTEKNLFFENIIPAVFIICFPVVFFRLLYLNYFFIPRKIMKIEYGEDYKYTCCNFITYLLIFVLVSFVTSISLVLVSWGWVYIANLKPKL